MEIRTNRLLLVPLGPQYLASTYCYSGNIENAKYMVYLPDSDISETESFLNRVHSEWRKPAPMVYEFAILLNKEHIGSVGVDIDEDKVEGELGWIIHKKHWGKGYAVEAAKEVIDFVVRERNIKKFIAHCDSENIGSYRVMEKLGMKLVSKTKGRRNKGSDEEREELLYCLEIN